MLIQLTMLKENLEDEEAGMPFEGMGVSKELRAFLDAEVGSGTKRNQRSVLNSDCLIV